MKNIVDVMFEEIDECIVEWDKKVKKGEIEEEIKITCLTRNIEDIIYSYKLKEGE